MRLWRYIEAHHEDFGVALFIIPMFLLVLAVLALCNAMVWLLH